jgi:hypothetical protein
VSHPAIRILPRSGILAIAVLLNAALFAMGIYFELHPRDRQDVWSAAGVATVALVNSAALTLPPVRPVGPRLVHRVRRIAYLANGLLLGVAAAIVGLEALLDWPRASIHGLALLLPPLLTLVALRLAPTG